MEPRVTVNVGKDAWMVDIVNNDPDQDLKTFYTPELFDAVGLSETEVFIRSPMSKGGGNPTIPYRYFAHVLDHAFNPIVLDKRSSLLAMNPVNVKTPTLTKTLLSPLEFHPIQVKRQPWLLSSADQGQPEAKDPTDPTDPTDPADPTDPTTQYEIIRLQIPYTSSNKANGWLNEVQEPQAYETNIELTRDGLDYDDLEQLFYLPVITRTPIHQHEVYRINDRWLPIRGVDMPPQPRSVYDLDHQHLEGTILHNHRKLSL